jgi:translation initiation factor IF-2
MTTSVKSIQLPDSMSIKDFSQLVELPASDIIKKLIGLGIMATINQEIDRDTMILIADEYGITATAVKTEVENLQFADVEDDPNSLVNRPPVVTILGHVDHGKTSLLDAIRQTNVTSQEAGGITQHIGAYQVELKERKITFLDTPGHAAFTAMRARGALVTDIAILVVAADDGVMPQTIEAINHVQDANVPIIVAINKIDKAGANLERIKTDLMQYGLVDEALGGETIFVPVSAKQRTGIETLLEMILLVADIKDFKANPNRVAKGTIIEAKLDKGRGPVATVLIQNGTLQVGDPIIAGAAAGKVKVLNNDKGKRVKKAGPSTPVEVIGFDEVPQAGDILQVAAEDRSARQLADKRMQYKRETELKKNQTITLDDLFTKIKEGEIKDLKLLIKADVQGSVEAIRQSLEKLSTEQVRVKVIQGSVGAIGDGDVMFALASNAIIIGFNVRPDPIAKRTAEKENVDIRLYRVIYNIIEDVQKAMEGMLDPTFKEVINGKAEIRQVYKVPKAGNVGGCYVLEGKITRNSDIRLIRDNIVILEGKIDSLKRFKDDAREVLEGFECGIGIEKYNDIKEGDIIEAFSQEEVKRAITK